jgi:hypothetical protein
MAKRICLIGLDEPEALEVQRRVGQRVLIRESVPRIMLDDGSLRVETQDGSQFQPIDTVVFHGIFEDDLDFLAALALWGGACFPNPRAMMDTRLRLPCLVHALRFSRFPMPRGYVSANVAIRREFDSVAKWGNWHCGENKVRVQGAWQSEHNTLLEPFLIGEAVRVALIGDHVWQIKLTGDTWLKSVHGEGACFMPADADLVDDTRRIRDGIGLELLANDYIVTPAGTKHLLEVNHIPSITCFEEIRSAYLDHVVAWLTQ